LVKNLDNNDQSFFLMMPSQILKVYKLSPEFSEKANLIYKGDKLTMFEIF